MSGLSFAVGDDPEHDDWTVRISPLQGGRTRTNGASKRPEYGRIDDGRVD